MAKQPSFPHNSGLCAACDNARLVASARGSVFVLCQEPEEYKLPKYPPLPVLECEGYEPVSAEASTPSSEQ